jgi:hypothetical protein
MSGRLAESVAATAILIGTQIIMTSKFKFPAVAGLLMLAACTTVPSGPGVMVLPGTGKSFDQFRADDFECRQFASAQIGGTTANQAAVDSGVKSAAVGTLVGAAAGAAMGGGRSAGVGAGVGLLAGSMVGASAAEGSAYGSQRRYDYAYTQCMYAKGHKVPVSGQFTSSAPGPAPVAAPAPPAPGQYTPPPPPPGSPPPR